MTFTAEAPASSVPTLIRPRPGPPIYDTPQLSYLPDGAKLQLPGKADCDLSGQPRLIDRYGHGLNIPNSYLLHLRINGYSLRTIEVYARYLLDFSRILADARSGKGMDWEEVDDGFLAAWQAHLTGPSILNGRGTSNRGIKPATFNDRLGQVLACLLHAEATGWVSRQIGEVGKMGPDIKIKIVREEGGIWHELQFATERRSEINIPTDRDLDLVEAELGRARKSRSLQERDRNMTALARKCTFRRSELTNLRVKDVPSRRRLKAVEDAVQRGAAPVVMVRVNRAKKKDPRRVVPMPLNLVISIRDYIDGPRKELLRRKGLVSPPEVFLSAKTGRALVPQSLTNSYKLAATAAHERNPDHVGGVELREVRLHHNRHKAITDIVAGYLRAGHSAGEAIIAAMEASGIDSLDTIAVYLHLGKALLAEGSEAHRQLMKERNDWTAAYLARGGHRSRRRRR